jgi:V/A-type H+-transporting ATPase subunit E
MPDTVSKTDNFLKAIEKYAEEQRGKLQSEVEAFREREMNAAEEEGLREAYTMIQKTMADINSRIARETSKADAASKKNIFLKRQQIEDEVFARAKEKLLAFCETEKYAALMKRSAVNISHVLKADDVVLYVRQDDMKYKAKLKLYFGVNCEIQPTDEIEIGGMIGVSRSMGLIADETLDAKLLQQREWFYENSGLTVTES